MSILDQPHSSAGQRQVQKSTVIIAAVATAVLILVGFVAYSAGAGKHTNERVLTGTAYVGHLQATVKVDGWSYGINESVPWIDAAGDLHDAGWPSCLGTVGTYVHFRFAEVPVTYPDQTRSRQVVWVDCRG